MSVAHVRSALVTKLIAANQFDSGAISYENVKFDAPSGKVWAAVTFMPADQRPATLGTGGDDRLDGIMQVDINTAPGTGEIAAATIFDNLRLAFPAGTVALYSGQAVTVMACSRSTGRVVNSFYRVTCSIRFYAFVQRQS